jgi:MarR family transcriptional regulator, organic hydroperoxide resistance regulator
MHLMSTLETAAPPIPDLDAFLCFAVHSTGFAFNRIYRKPLGRLGLTYPQFLVMAALWGEDGVAVGALGEKLALDTSTLTPLLKRLEGMGLLTRRRAQEDERRVMVSLTEKGSAMRAHAGEIMRCVFAAADLSPEAFDKLTRDIQALRRNLERAAAGA